MKINDNIVMSIFFHTFITILLHSLTLMCQSLTRKNCFAANYNSNTNSTKLDKNTCINISSECCYATVNYKLHELEINSSFCIEPNKLLNQTVLDIMKTLYNDIHRQVRRDWESYDFTLDSNDTIIDKYKNKKYFCPLNCSNPVYELEGCNNTITDKDYFEQTAKSLFDDFFENLNLKPMYDGDNIENSCRNIFDDKCLDTDESIDNFWKNFEDELNYQYNFTQCISKSCNNSTENDIVIKNNLKFIGRVEYAKQKRYPKNCIPLPKIKDLIKANIVCPPDYKDTLVDNTTSIEVEDI